MNNPQIPSRTGKSPASSNRSRLKTVADLLPAISFFGVFLLFGRDLVLASAGLFIALLVQLAIYRTIQEPIPTWMKVLTGIALVFAAMTLLFRDPSFIKIRASVSGFIIGCVFIGSVLIRKNILQLLLEKMIEFPSRTWNIITVLWSVPIFLNAGLNLFLANLIPWIDWQISDEIWVGYRAVGGFIVIGCSFALIAIYLVLTKQKPLFTTHHD